MGEFKDLRKIKRKAKEADSDAKTLGKAIEERGRKTIKLPHLSDKETGRMMVSQGRLSRKSSRLSKIYKKKRNIFVGKTGAKAVLAGAAAYGGKRLYDNYNNSIEKQAGYIKRLKDSLGRTLNFTRKSNEIKASSDKARRGIERELKKKKPDKGELGHLNAKKVKEGDSAKKKKNAERAAKVLGPAALVGSGVLIKKKYDEAEPARMTHMLR